MLPIMDDFERAIKAFEEVEDSNSLKEGINLIYNKFKSTLTAKGIEPLESKGKEFDTDYHEALTQIPAPSDDLKGKVIDEIEKGYLLNGKIIRFAKVVVGK
jgi:molecular chaperone GrpE